MIILGFESSANKLGISILKDDIILSNKRYTYITPPGQGFVPSATARHHRQKILCLLKEVLIESKTHLRDIDLFSFTRGPGMMQPLQVSALVCRILSIRYKKPIIGVNHCVAHIEMGRLITGAIDPVILYVSGGNTQVIGYNERYRIFGETLDIAIGNCLDRVCRELQISNDPSPGYNFEVLAKEGKKLYPLPYVIKGMDVSFSSIVDHVKKLIKDGAKAKDIAFTVQETLFAMLIEVTERALAYLNKKEILLVGGVGCNKRFQEMMKIMADERGAVLYATDERYCIDNGAMIAYTAYLMYKSGIKHDIEHTSVVQRYRTDEVEVTWRE